MSSAVEDIEDFFSPAVCLLGLYNAEERATDKDEFQQTLQDHIDRLWQLGKSVGSGIQNIKNRLHLLDNRAHRLSKDLTRLIGRLDHKSVQHRWQQVMLMYSNYGQRIRDLAQLCTDLDVGDDGILYPQEAADQFADDVLGCSGNLSVKECLFHIHNMIVGGTLFIHAPLFETYLELTNASKLRHQSVRWHVQVYMSHVIAIELVGLVLLTTALNIRNRYGEVETFLEQMKMRLEEQDNIIKETCSISDPSFYPSSSVEEISVTYVDAKSDSIENIENNNSDVLENSRNASIANTNGFGDDKDNLTDTNEELDEDEFEWCPIMGAQLYRKQEGVLSLKFTVMQCLAVDPSREWGPPKATKVTENTCDTPKQQRSHILGERVTLSWTRVRDPLRECICGVRFITEPPKCDVTAESSDDPDLMEKPAPVIGLECIVFSKNDSSAPKYILPPNFEEQENNCVVVTKGGQGKRLNLFSVDVGGVVPKQPGWVTAVRLHQRGGVLSLALETSYW